MSIQAKNLLRLYAPEELGSDGYPAEWHRTIKHLVREQAGHRCIRCHHPYLVKVVRENVTSTPGYERRQLSTGKMVQVSPCDAECRHGGPVLYWTPKTGWGEYDGPDETIADTVLAIWRVLTVHHLDGDKANCRWWNLAALCQRCHLTIQGRVKMAQVYIGEHSEWFQPYAAGYYAHVYLDQDLTRAETLERLDELLALECHLAEGFALADVELERGETVAYDPAWIAASDPSRGTNPK